MSVRAFGYITSTSFAVVRGENSNRRRSFCPWKCGKIQCDSVWCAAGIAHCTHNTSPPLHSLTHTHTHKHARAQPTTTTAQLQRIIPKWSKLNSKGNVKRARTYTRTAHTHAHARTYINKLSDQNTHAHTFKSECTHR